MILPKDLEPSLCKDYISLTHLCDLPAETLYKSLEATKNYGKSTALGISTPVMASLIHTHPLAKIFFASVSSSLKPWN